MMKSNCMGNNPRMKMGANQFNMGNNQMNYCFSMMKQMFGSESDDSTTCCEPGVQIPSDLAALFNEWYKALEEEIIWYTKEAKEINVDKIASEFKLSHESVLLLLNSIKKKEKQNSES